MLLNEEQERKLEGAMDYYETDKDLEMLQSFADELREFYLDIHVFPMLWFFRKRFYVIVYRRSMFVTDFKGGYWECHKLLLAMQASAEAGVETRYLTEQQEDGKE